VFSVAADATTAHLLRQRIRKSGQPGLQDAWPGPAGRLGHPVLVDLDTRIETIGRQPFRAKFHLRGRDRATAILRGPAAIRTHARELIDQRLAPAEPRNDGKQTPYRGHPVFVAQHATATCCRTCLRKNHAIPPGVELTAGQREYVVDVICRWIERELTSEGA
jgi:hypothetical protein